MSLKIFLSNALVRFRLNWLVRAYGHARGQPVAHLRHAKLGDRFSEIYKDGIWATDASVESLSGKGSSVAGTQVIREALPEILKRLDATSLIDVGCGDYNWMREVQLPVEYLGVDIVPAVIFSNKASFERPGVQFLLADATEDTLPSTDAALCREVLFHLSFYDGRRLLRNLKVTGAKYFICTSDPTLEWNIDIISGGWRELNLQIPPFNFPSPEIMIKDSQTDNGSRVLGVWAFPSIPD